VSKRGQDVVGGLPSVLFQPDDIQILIGAPGFRRRFMDQVLMQVSPSYARGISTLNHVLKQRNKLLKQIQEGKAQEKELHFWDQELGSIHAITRPQREKLLNWLAAHLPDAFSQMVPEVGKVGLEYGCSPKETDYSTSQLFVEKVQHNRMKEIAAGVSLYGPHREDFHLTVNLRPVNHCLSRGQLRSLLLALKMAELKFLSEFLDTKPLLLLDDVLSELDGLRRERLGQLLGEYQTVISAVEWPEIFPEGKKDTSLIQMK
jgi:DNA replication and repair protein RecF